MRIGRVVIVHLRMMLLQNFTGNTAFTGLPIPISDNLHFDCYNKNGNNVNGYISENQSNGFIIENGTKNDVITIVGTYLTKN